MFVSPVLATQFDNKQVFFNSTHLLHVGVSVNHGDFHRPTGVDDILPSKKQTNASDTTRVLIDPYSTFQYHHAGYC